MASQAATAARHRSAVERRAARRTTEIHRSIGRDLARLREDAGLSRAAVARAARLSASTVGRIEDASLVPRLDTVVRLAAVLGCDASFRLYPVGPPIRDRFQAPMLEALLRAVDPAWARHPEVPVEGVGRGVIDLVLLHPYRPLLVAVEVHSEVRRAEEVIRRAAEKAAALASGPVARRHAERVGADDPLVSRLLLLRSTLRARSTVQELAHTFGAAYPSRAAEARAALRDATVAWPGSAIVWADLHGRRAILMGGPARGVTVGR